MRKIIKIYALFLVAVIIAPLFWSVNNNISIDLPKLTEEWIKGWFSLFQLFLAFVVFTYMYKNSENEEKKKKLGMIKDDINSLKTEILSEFSQREKFKSEKMLSELLAQKIVDVFDNIKFIKKYSDSISDLKLSFPEITDNIIYSFDYVNKYLRSDKLGNVDSEEIGAATKNLTEYLESIRL
jgi:hypothetical protein